MAPELYHNYCWCGFIQIWIWNNSDDATNVHPIQFVEAVNEYVSLNNDTPVNYYQIPLKWLLGTVGGK